MLNDIQKLKELGDFAAISKLIPYSAVIGLECEVINNSILTRLKHLESNIGNYQMGFLHGGTVAALLEHAAIFHLLYEMEIQILPRIVNISVDYLRPCTGQDTLASATLIKQGKRIANVRVQAWQTNPARPVAAAHAHFLLS
ncbi:MAG: PaaI family thioesterase [Rhodospirillales bacterium]|nr:PaaI family thioesterase [Rhodospirillales bacterium]